MAGLCDGGNEPPGSLKANKKYVVSTWDSINAVSFLSRILTMKLRIPPLSYRAQVQRHASAHRNGYLRVFYTYVLAQQWKENEVRTVNKISKCDGVNGIDCTHVRSNGLNSSVLVTLLCNTRGGKFDPVLWIELRSSTGYYSHCKDIKVHLLPTLKHKSSRNKGADADGESSLRNIFVLRYQRDYHKKPKEDQYRVLQRCRREFEHRYTSVRIPSRSTIHDLVNKVRRTGPFLNKKCVQQRRVLTEEKLDEVGARLEHSPANHCDV
ncbi:hypothetical protein ANN_09816 [Periplaneta americana]|uniref:Uncharacterized protein n=1 Tax=Periplaneta americana TaxID=6978 RepID=A0ABQ8TMC5_PERAM|nr:hypothetical protein ANN_09816 [Periplaneta americana]